MPTSSVRTAQQPAGARLGGGLDDRRRRDDHAGMAEEKVETVRSSSSGTIGRGRNEARGVALALDSSARPRPDAFTNSEAFLGGISSCGVTLVEMHAQETGVPLERMTVTIEGRRPPSEPRFTAIALTFELAGVSQAQAEELVETYRKR
jgi:uncharacterized OsmC-like protein